MQVFNLQNVRFFWLENRPGDFFHGPCCDAPNLTTNKEKDKYIWFILEKVVLLRLILMMDFLKRNFSDNGYWR